MNYKSILKTLNLEDQFGDFLSISQWQYFYLKEKLQKDHRM